MKLKLQITEGCTCYSYTINDMEYDDLLDKQDEYYNPEFSNSRQAKYFIIIINGKLLIDFCYGINKGAVVYFKSEELARQAINILGEHTIKEIANIYYY